MTSGIFSEAKWYSQLVVRPGASREALLACESFVPNTEIIVAKDISSEKNSKSFSKFASYLSFDAWMRKVCPEERHFYEVITNSCLQKPYFDIDLKIPGKYSEQYVADIENSVSRLARVASSAARGARVAPKSLVFSSNSREKLSYHIVIDGIACISHEENKDFAAFVLSQFRIESEFDKEVVAAVDRGMYKSLQQLRILGSRKIGTDRTKRARLDLSEWLPDEKEKPRLMEARLMCASLITATAECNIMPSDCAFFRAKVSKTQSSVEWKVSRKASKEASVFVSAEEAQTVLDVICEKLMSLGAKTTPFSLRDHLGNCTSEVDTNIVIIPLCRNAPSWCPSCERVHSAEHPFIRLNTQTKTIFFNCRRGGKSVTAEWDVNGVVDSVSESESEIFVIPPLFASSPSAASTMQQSKAAVSLMPAQYKCRPLRKAPRKQPTRKATNNVEQMKAVMCKN
jgi:hypothetical protein